MQEDIPIKADLIIIDHDIAQKVKVTPSLLTFRVGQPAIAIINQKIEDLFKEGTDRTEDCSND